MTSKMNNKFRMSLKTHWRYPLILVCFLLMNVFTVFGQNIMVKGTVTEDGTAEPIPGVNIIVEGTSNGVITDLDGKYQIEVASDAQLIFSFIGFADKKVSVNGQTAIDVELVSAFTSLDEVVAIGYGTAKKKDLTGAVASVNENTLKGIPVASAAEAVTGRMAGVHVTSTEGSPDAEIKIRVRGGGSITQDNSPLYIVDGFPVSSISDVAPSDIETVTVLKDASSTAIYGAQGANGVFLITTKSGKKGKVTVNVNSYVGVRRVSDLLDVLSPYEYVMYQYELDQSDSFKKYYGAYDDLEIYKSVKGTNWQDEVFGRTAFIQNFNASVSGGSENTRFSIGLSRSDEESVMLGSGFERNNVTFKLNTKINNSLSLDFNTRASYTVIDGAGVSDGSGSTSRLRNSVKYAPTKGLREFDSTLQDQEDLNDAESSSLLYDPVESTLDDYKEQTKYRSTTSAAVNWKIIKGLKFRSEWGAELRYERTDRVWGPSTSQAKRKAGQPVAQIKNYEQLKWRNANTLNYINEFIAGHKLNLLLGHEISSLKNKSVTSDSEFFPGDMTADDVLSVFNFGIPQPTSTYISAKSSSLSYFGRAIYSMHDKYMVSGTFRADGLSKFADGNRWGYFPSVAAAWRVSEESFLQGQSDWLSNLKLRLSYGTAGNARLKDGLWKQTNKTTGDKAYYTDETEDRYLIPSSTLYNPDLTWETTYTKNVGLDFGFFRNRLSGTLDAYLNTTKDLLIQAPVATSSGYVNQYRNVGQTTNKGLELNLEGHIIDKGDFSLSMNFNISFNKNVVDVFKNGDENFKTYSSGWNGSAAPYDDYIIREGEPVGQMYGYVTDGMYSFDDFTFNWVRDEEGNATSASKWVINEDVTDNSKLTSPVANYFGPGSLKFKDISGPDGTPDGVIDSYDKKIIGDANPIHTGGFGINTQYKGFDLSAFFNWSYGNDVYNANKLDYSAFLLTRKYQNLSSEMSMENRFTTIDPTTGNNIFYGADANPELLQSLNEGATIWSPKHTQTALHSWAVEDGSFLRLNNVTIGYTLPKRLVSKANIQKLRLYVTGYNLYTWTNYSGFDPEVDTRRKTPLTPSVDYSAYPKSISIIGGINLTF